MTTDQEIDLELAYQPWEGSCRSPRVTGIPDTPDGVDQVCRRPLKHDGDCATGYGKNRRRWVKAA